MLGSSTSNFTSFADDVMVGPPDAGSTTNFRQNVERNSLQINANAGLGTLEIDIDLFNPSFGLAPAVAHGAFEVLKDKLTGSKTDPFSMSSALRKLGLDLGHNCDKYNR